jgi:hypothetical protein
MANVTFTPKLPNFYVRDPRVPTPPPNPFYDANNPLANPATPGVAGTPASLSSLVGTPSLNNYRSYGTSVPSVVAAQNPGATYLTGGNPAPSVNGSGSQVPGTRINTPGSSDSAINSPQQPVKQAPAPGLDNSVGNRLSIANLPPAADYGTMFTTTNSPSTTLAEGEDTRVMISDPSGKLIGSGSQMLAPLTATNGVIFPYTPTINFKHAAHYEMESLVHTNYDFPTYRNSNVDTISLQAKFTASSAADATYMLAVIHFFRSATKMFYGQDSLAGTPPPVLRLDGYGNWVIDHLPVVVTSFDYTLPEDVDYISTKSSDSPGYASEGSSTNATNMVPTNMQMNIGLKILHSRTRLARDFGLEKFISGGLITNAKRGTGGRGGFI